MVFFLGLNRTAGSFACVARVRDGDTIRLCKWVP